MDTKQLDELEKLHRDFTNSQSVLRYDALSMAATRALPSLISQAREAIALRDENERLRAEVAELSARNDRQFTLLQSWPGLECPCCGELDAARAKWFEDGQETTCGCGGIVFADGYAAHIEVDECENAESAPTPEVQR